MPSNPETAVPQFGINTLMSMPRQCYWCGFIHGPKCPWIKAIEYYPDGITVRRVEFVCQEQSA